MAKIKDKKRFEANTVKEPVTRYISEGNPNTDKVIEKAQHTLTGDDKLVHDAREAIAKEKGIGYIQVMAHNGILVLSGQVRNHQEKMSIGDKAVAVAGFGKVDNQLQVIKEE